MWGLSLSLSNPLMGNCLKEGKAMQRQQRQTGNNGWNKSNICRLYGMIFSFLFSFCGYPWYQVPPDYSELLINLIYHKFTNQYIYPNFYISFVWDNPFINYMKLHKPDIIKTTSQTSFKDLNFLLLSTSRRGLTQDLRLNSYTSLKPLPSIILSILQ